MLLLSFMIFVLRDPSIWQSFQFRLEVIRRWVQFVDSSIPSGLISQQIITASLFWWHAVIDPILIILPWFHLSSVMVMVRVRNTRVYFSKISKHFPTRLLSNFGIDCLHILIKSPTPINSLSTFDVRSFASNPTSYRFFYSSITVSFL